MQGISLKDNTTQVAADVSAASIGYLVGKNNIDKIPQWNSWLVDLLALEPGDTVISYEGLLKQGLALAVDDPFLEMQLGKLINLLDFPELQPPDLPYLKAEYLEMVKLVLQGFSDGLTAALNASKQ